MAPQAQVEVVLRTAFEAALANIAAQVAYADPALGAQLTSFLDVGATSLIDMTHAMEGALNDVNAAVQQALSTVVGIQGAPVTTTVVVDGITVTVTGIDVTGTGALTGEPYAYTENGLALSGFVFRSGT